ncbi:hypothetical protein DTL21_08755 [Bremerella cremea]|uniref:Uncharacterized protein n=2 Tax=Pirellulales TaxID=2691354 RepID=A0A2S8FV00_9BACT|nr:hypothetical protein C5Y83_08750 [Blastopirellula marina]RCS48682.1 hypothetical protein DTL21_08755 [Bremerella cremea]
MVPKNQVFVFVMHIPINPGGVTAAVALLLGVVGIWLLIRIRSGLRGTTLTAAWAWAMVAWVCLVGCEIVIGVCHQLELSIVDNHWRYLAAMGLFLPTLAQVGAKRRHLVAWQLLMLAFWSALSVPVLEIWFLDSAGRSDPGWIWGCFLGLLMIAGLLNNLATRFGPAALCLAIAQGLMVYPYLPWASAPVTTGGALLSMGVLLLGMGMVAFRSQARSEIVRPENQAWLDFRDQFGSFWALRVMQRVNDAAVRYDWGLWLGWDGFHQVEIVGSDPEFRDEVRQGLVACLRKLLGDFVDQEWLDARLPKCDPKKNGMEDLEA